MYILTKLWHNQQWKQFARTFHRKYDQADEEQKLRMLRALLCEWKDTNAIRAVVHEYPELAKVTFGQLLDVS